MRKIAVIDIGTHSILYLLAGKNTRDSIIAFSQDIRSIRLGRKVDENGIIHEEPLHEAIHTLKEFKKLAQEQGANRIVVVATQVLRSAKNKENVCKEILEATDLSVQILSEEEEAQASYMGALSERRLKGPTGVVDIGGGSTEAILGNSKRINDLVSIRLGAVNMTERFLRQDPPSEKDFASLTDFVDTSIRDSIIPLLKKGRQLVGVGGTVTTLAALDLDMKQYDSNHVDGYMMHRSRIENILDQLKRLPLAERKKRVRIDPERADILVAGTYILTMIMALAGFEEILASDKGLRWGIAERELNITELHQE